MSQLKAQAVLARHGMRRSQFADLYRAAGANPRASEAWSVLCEIVARSLPEPASTSAAPTLKQQRDALAAWVRNEHLGGERYEHQSCSICTLLATIEKETP